MSNRGHLVRVAAVSGESTQPLFKYGVSESMQNLSRRQAETAVLLLHLTPDTINHESLHCYQKDGVVGGGVGLRTRPIEEDVDKIVKVGHGDIHLAIWFIVAL